MTFDEILTKVRTIAQKVDASGMGFLAVQVNLTGDNGGVFYVEVKDGAIAVEPYEYKENDIKVTASADDILLITSGKISYTELLSDGRAYGDGIKASKLDAIAFKEAAAKKTAAKKPAA